MDDSKLTAKGQATKARIVEVAADLMYREGMQGATNDDVRRAAAVSGSQLSHYFRDRESLVRAVIDWRATRVVELSRVAPSGRLDSIEALRAWADFYLASQDRWEGGCRFGSLASQALKSDLDVNDAVRDGFGLWEDAIREGLTAMRDEGVLSREADPERLTYTLLSAYQGGILLAQAEGRALPLRAALDGAIAYIASFVPAAD